LKLPFRHNRSASNSSRKTQNIPENAVTAQSPPLGQGLHGANDAKDRSASFSSRSAISTDSFTSQDSASMSSSSSIVVGDERSVKITRNGNPLQAIDSELLYEKDLQVALEKSCYEL
jgi:hypothetical protein